MTTPSYDVLIIGGGIIGASIAYFTSEKGLKVGMLERDTVASGTSSKCDGNVLLIDKEPGFDSNMAIKSQALIKSLSKELEMKFEYRHPGSIFLCANEEELEQAYDWVDQHNRANGEYQFFNKLTKEDLKNDSKYFADHLVGGIECTNDSTVNPYMLTFSFIHAAKKNDLELFEKTPVTFMEEHRTKGFKVHSHDRVFKANKVINAAGVFAPEVSKHLGVPLPIKPRKGHILVSSRAELMGTRKIQEFGYLMTKFGKERKADKIMNDYGIALVHEPTESQNFLIGSSREFIGFDTTVNHQVVQLIAKRAIEFFPKMKDMNIIRSYAGLRPWTPDHLPIISETTVPNYYVAAGHEGDGIGLSAVTGYWMAQMVTDTLEDDISPLSMERFQEEAI
ncbi:glycine oxidase [Oceanobacillus oncorhynchi subsp. incaldanensis]|uniref:Aerobic glycerol-3-phosphate dehydrogenase n=2 Tax=Oceanobacillus TaxID=182709 RepID=A0A0A1MQ25_9BACI|nr:FAD-dependent oxidoreductase [Oceanobacillus oncorhynchi]MDM8099828.1 FAD-dependent oxidoreductase [Oceanobacillus oncorhynchi]UUI40368.1 FAD-binding oxidoreductase [Oceanobacillus oncorhynchi]GIO20659.1 glycine oxidase [Oceanobacillus oncorhynchi subsp. incaldanensis]CEI81799.1 Hydrogen cyanide synthase subunit HcnC precursor [Oceanobacillus oncorhynchi]